MIIPEDFVRILIAVVHLAIYRLCFAFLRLLGSGLYRVVPSVPKWENQSQVRECTNRELNVKIGMQPPQPPKEGKKVFLLLFVCVFYTR